MTDPGFLHIDPDTVVRSGHETAGTADDWLAWGRRIRGSFYVADNLVQNQTIQAAMGEYAGGVIAGAERVGQRVSNLGGNTAAAGTTAENADSEAAAELSQYGSLLQRPMNSGAPAPVNGQPVPTL